MKRLSQLQKIENLLLKGKSITTVQAIDRWRILRLGAIIGRLRRYYDIKTTLVKSGRTRIAKYEIGR